MNLEAAIALRCGGPGSGCRGDNCGRRSEGVHLVPSSSKYLSGDATHRFDILNANKNPIGDIHVHMAKDGELGGSKVLPKGTLVVDMVSSNDQDEEMPVGLVRDIGKALKQEFPEAKFLAGMRISGSHYSPAFREQHRQASGYEERKQLSTRLWTVVPFQAMAEFV